MPHLSPHANGERHPKVTLTVAAKITSRLAGVNGNVTAMLAGVNGNVTATLAVR